MQIYYSRNRNVKMLLQLSYKRTLGEGLTASNFYQDIGVHLSFLSIKPVLLFLFQVNNNPPGTTIKKVILTSNSRKRE